MSRLLANFMFPLMAPEAPAAGSETINKAIGGPAEMDKESVIEFLADDDENKETIELIPDKDKKEDKKDTKKETKEPEEEDEESEEDEDDELKDIEAELEEPTEEQLELVTPVRRREILKKYPEIFKDFPYLEKAYYREQQFTELLPTIDDAKKAVQAKQILDNFEKDLMSGNSETILKAVASGNPDAFYKIVDNYLPTLRNVDEKAYFHVLGNLTKHTISAMVQEANRSQNQQLKDAALLLNQFVFGTSDWVPPQNLAKPQNKEASDKERQLSEREQTIVRQQFENTRNDLNSRVNNTLKNTISAHIDPKSSMSDYVRRNAERDAMENLTVLIDKDARFKALADKLWEKAYQEGFTQEARDRIKSAYLSKAKTLLPAVIKKARNEALRGIGKRVRDDDSSDKDRRGPINQGQPRSQRTPTGKITDAKDIPKGMRTIDFLSSD